MNQTILVIITIYRTNLLKCFTTITKKLPISGIKVVYKIIMPDKAIRTF